MQEESIFIEALDIEDTAERAAFLDRVCAGDAALRRRMERLLQRHQQADSFLESSPATPAALDEPVPEGPGTVIGPYKLLEQIGEGGFGIVFMAEQQEPIRRKVALKILKPGMDTRQVMARFEAERQALAILNHPNIAKVLDAGHTSSGRPYFVMDLVKGLPITEYCDRATFTPRERLELFVSVCSAVQHAHQKGIIHRDLKPSNVLVTQQDGAPLVKVIDFGIAKALGQRLTDKTLFTGFAQMIGSPLYMSPEQAALSNVDVDTRSDIYSLGVLLYELLTGTTPFERQRFQQAGYDEMRRIIREEEPPKPSTRLSTLQQAATAVSLNRKSDPKRLSQLIRGELDWIVMKALEKDRNRRYESASAFAADVQRYLHDEPVLACPPSVAYRLRNFARRNKAALSVSGLVLFFLVLIGSGVGWALRDRAAREADLARDKAARQAKLNLEIAHALDDASKARDLALKLTDNPSQWKAGLAAAASELKRAQGLAAQDETALEPALRERLQEMQTLVDADEADRRFAARFEEIRLEQAEVNVAISDFKYEIGFSALKEAFGRYYRIAFGATPVEQAAAILRQRPQAIQDVLLTALEICLNRVPKNDPQTRQWLSRVLDAADTGPWRKRVQQALQASDWKAFEQLFEEAVRTRQPASRLFRLVRETPFYSATRLKVARRFREACPGDFWANHDLAILLHHDYGQPEEASRYYTAALALRPHNPAACVNLGSALYSLGDLDGAIAAYREALDGHPEYAMARKALSETLERRGDVDGAIAQLREGIRLSNSALCHLSLGNLLLRNGRRDEAIASYQKAVALDPNHAIAHANLGTALLEKKECRDEAIASFQNVIACYRRALASNPADAGCHNDLAWFLVTCPYVPLRDPAEGMKLARKAVELGPSGHCWNTLGVAHYRAGEWKEAVAALEKAMQLRGGGDSYDWFFLAMAYWQLGEKDKASQWFDKAVQWMDKNMPKGKELGRIRAEAAELLQGRVEERVTPAAQAALRELKQSGR